MPGDTSTLKSQQHLLKAHSSMYVFINTLCSFVACFVRKQTTSKGNVFCKYSVLYRRTAEVGMFLLAMLRLDLTITELQGFDEVALVITPYVESVTLTEYIYIHALNIYCKTLISALMLRSSSALILGNI